MVAEFDKKPFDLILKQDYEHQYPYAHKLVHNRADELHLQNLRGDKPYHYKGEYTVEYVDSAGFLHYPVDIKEEQGYYRYIESIFNAKRFHRWELRDWLGIMGI